MKLTRKISQIRRDFKGEYVCENCEYTRVDKGLRSYDDDNFHLNVIPEMKCPECEESTNSLGLKNQPMKTKYPSHTIV